MSRAPLLQSGGAEFKSLDGYQIWIDARTGKGSRWKRDVLRKRRASSSLALSANYGQLPEHGLTALGANEMGRNATEVRILYCPPHMLS